VNFKKFKKVIGALVASGLIGFSAQANALYGLLDLGSLSTNPIDVSNNLAIGGLINSSSQVAGTNLNTFAPTFWNGVASVSLSTLGGSMGSAYSVNNASVITGWSTINGDDSAWHATVWNGSTTTDLGTLGGTNSEGSDINNANQVVGWSHTLNDNNYHATIWNGTVATDLVGLGGISSDSEAFAINDNSQVVGWSENSSGVRRATSWVGNNIVDLGALSDSGDSEAYDINNAGRIVGVSAFGSVDHAVMWSGGSITDLGTLGGSFSVATGINSSGFIVGNSQILGDGAYHATLWTDDGATIIDLNTLLDASFIADGWVLNDAYAINDNGWIVAQASNSILGIASNTVLLSQSVAAVAEPETYAMLLIGLGLIGFNQRKKLQVKS
jgi:probable HAF family extracellular repeat protein